MLHFGRSYLACGFAFEALVTAIILTPLRSRYIRGQNCRKTKGGAFVIGQQSGLSRIPDRFA